MSKYPFRVIEVSPGVRPVFGETGADAVALVIQGLSENLGRLGVQVTVLDVLPRKSFNSFSSSVDTVEVVRIHNPLSFLVRRGYSTGAGKKRAFWARWLPSREGWVELAFMALAVLKLIKLVSTNNGEGKVIVHVHISWEVILICILKKVYGFRIVYTTHNHGVLMPTKDLRPGCKSLFFEKLAVEMSDFIVTPSQPVASNVGRFFGVPPSKVLAIPFGVDSSQYSMQGGGNAENFDVLCVARIQRRKNQMVLLQALEQLQLKGYRFTLALIGPVEDSDYYEELVQFVRQKRLAVKFLGEVSRKKLQQLYAGASIIAIPSLQETQCLVLFEALASARPVVASRIEPFISLIGEKSTCVKFASPCYPIEWASVIAELMSDSALLSRMGRAARIFVSQAFSTERTVKDYIKIFQNI